MARDFATRPSGRKPAKRKRPQPARLTFHGPSFAAGIVLGALVLGAVVYLPGRLATEPGPVAQAAVPETPFRFEFHRLLQNSEVAVDPSAYGSERAEDVAQEYLLQAGSFRDAVDAERLKARLLLIDMPVATSTITLEDGPWHRVTVGPFPTRKDTRHALNKLRQLDIPALWLARPKAGGTAG